MLGLAVGDALGAALEWDHPDQIVARFGGPLRDMVASKMWQLGEWTDDTAMAVALARAWPSGRGYDEGDVLARYLVWSRSAPKDIGATVRHALARARSPEDARAGGRRVARTERRPQRRQRLADAHRPDRHPFRNDRGAIERISRAESSLTHHDPLAGDACAFLNITIAELLIGRQASHLDLAGRPGGGGGRGLTAEQLLEPVQRQMGFVLTAMRVAYWAAFSAGRLRAGGGLGREPGRRRRHQRGRHRRAGRSPLRRFADPAALAEPLLAKDHISGLATRLLRE